MENDWIEEIPNYLTFENLVFKPHRLTKGLPDWEELNEYRGVQSILDNFKGMVQAYMTFDGPDVWISVVGGGPTYSNMEDDEWEVWSSNLMDPCKMNREEITEHMKELQGLI